MNPYRALELQGKGNKKKDEYKYFVGSTERDALSYRCSEKIVFRIRARHKDEYLDIPYILYSLLGEDGKRESGYLEKSADGWFYIETSLSKSGFVYLNAKACDGEKSILSGIEEYNGSAGAEVDLILPATKVPEDYEDFRRSLSRAVEETEPRVLYSQKIEDRRHPDFEIFNMRIAAPRSEYASFVVSYPRNAKKGSLGLALLFQGYGVTPATPWPKEGYLTVHVNAHALPNEESPAFYAAMRDGALKGYGYNAEENNKSDTTYFSKMLLRDLAVLRFFEHHELLNGKDYIFVGSSQGGMQACNMASLFEKATAAILNVPGFSDVMADELAGRRKNAMPKGAGVAYYDTAVAAQYLRCPTYIISGLGDSICCSSSQMALFNAIRAPKYIEFYQNKVHSFTIPWDERRYALGNEEIADTFSDFAKMYLGWN